VTVASRGAATVTQLLVEGARHGRRPCFSLVSAEDSRIRSSLTFAELVDDGKRAAATLQGAGVARGDRVMIAASPSPGWLTTFAGALFAGGVAVPVNHNFRRRELAGVITASEPTVVVVDAVTREEAAAAAEQAGLPVRLLDLGQDDLLAAEQLPPVEVEPSELAVILHTSGTTGRPKGVERTHGDYALFMRWFGSYAMSPDDRVLNFLPLYHQAGLLCSFLPAFTLGIPLFHIDRFSRSTFWSTVDTHGLTWGILMQPVPRYLLAREPEPADRSHALRWVIATLSPEDWIAFQERFGVAVNSTYGSTETTIIRTTGSRRQGQVAPERIQGPLGGALCGRVVDGWAEARVVTEAREPATAEQPGFIEARGHPVFQGYFRDPDATSEVLTEDGWFRTGDYGYVSAGGELYYLDRAKGLIRRSGEFIAPREVEEVLEEHPAVAEAAVVGVRDEVRGEEIAAFVVPRPGASLRPVELFDFCADRLAYFKLPRYLELRDELPHTPTFKVRRDALELTSACIDRSRTDAFANPR
jgi:acyl-CoA synthetase (AMP-forming)/AMP-acid ligase II